MRMMGVGGSCGCSAGSAGGSSFFSSISSCGDVSFAIVHLYLHPTVGEDFTMRQNMVSVKDLQTGLIYQIKDSEVLLES
jgi:hypothetical protein